jgi:hypothetical protein
LPQVVATWEGTRPGYAELDLGLRLIRELTLLAIVAYALSVAGVRSLLLAPKNLCAVSMLGGYVTFEFWRALELGYPLIVPLTGLRVFEYVPLAYVGAYLHRQGHGSAVLTRLAAYLRIYIIVQLACAVAQSLWAPPLHGVSMFGGGRAFGTFVSPNLYGVAMAALALLYAMSNLPGRGRWILLCFLATLLSGSRTAILLAGLVFAFNLYQRCRAQDRPLLLLLAPLLALGGLLLASTEAISGRSIQLEDEGRLRIWTEVVAGGIHNVSDLLFGWGLGLGSNTVNLLFGKNHFPGQFDSDSLYLFLLNSYGLVGLAFYLLILFVLARERAHPTANLCVLFLLFAGLPFNIWEYFPANAILAFSAGLLWPSVQRFRLGGPGPEVRAQTPGSARG